MIVKWFHQIGVGGSIMLIHFLLLFCLGFLFVCLFALGHTQGIWKFPGRGRIRAVAASLHHSQRGIWAASATYTTAHSNTGSLTHWAGPEIEPVSSWIIGLFLLCHTGNSLSHLVYWRPKEAMREEGMDGESTMPATPCTEITLK